MLTEQSVIDKIEVLEDGVIQVRRADRVLRDGVVIAHTYHRHLLLPSDSLGDQDARVAAVAKAIWTRDVIAAFEAKAVANA